MNIVLPFRGNRFIHGNSLKILQKLPNNFVDVIITDPPYNVMKKRNLTFKNRGDIIQDAAFDHFQTKKIYLEFLESWISLAFHKLKENGSVYIFIADEFLSDLIEICVKSGFKRKSTIVWHKTNPAPQITKSGYISSTELLFHCTKGEPFFNFISEDERMHNFIETPICMGKERLKDEKGKTVHPTQKPISVIRWILDRSAEQGYVVLDLFAGVATTNDACARFGCHCIGIELNQRYWFYGNERMKKIIPLVKTRQMILGRKT